jgi:hypothetical protein
MRKKGDQQNIPKEFFPGDSEDFKIEGPSDTFSSNNKSNQVNNSISNNKFSVYNNSIIRSNNNKFNLQDSEESNNNKFKNDYKPKSKRIDNDEDDELEAMLNQTKMKQKENKLKEKSIIINPSEFQIQNSNNKYQNSQNEIKNMKDKNEESINNIYNNSNNNYSSNINKSNKKKAQRYDDLNSIGNSYQSSSINDNVNIKGDNSSNTFMNSQLKLSSTQKSNLTNNIRNTHINNINNESSNEISMNAPKYKMPKRNPELTKEEIILNEKINFNNYTDDIIEEFFTKNNFDDSPNFFYDLASEMQNGQRHINHKLKKIIKDDEINNAKLAQKKQEYITKLEKIKKNNSAFEQKVNDLNELYCDKLSYISLISKNLYEYEKFHKNIDFTVKLFDYINMLNKTDNYVELKLPPSLTDSELIIDEGIEIYLAFKEVQQTCKNKPEYENFIKNFGTLEDKVKNTIKSAIAKSYTDNNLQKLRHIFGVTETMKNDLMTNLYVDYIVEDIMRLKEQKEEMKKVQFSVDGISEDLFTLIFKQADNFHETILVNADTQFGKEYSKIYIIFPESQYKIVSSIMINTFIKYLTEFRTIFISERDKNEETYVRMVQYIYPKTVSFNEQFKNVVTFTKTDLEGALEQETNIFLRTVEGIYMNKEKTMLEYFITSSYKSMVNQMKKIKAEFSEIKKGKLKGEKLTNFVLDYLNRLYDSIQSTNFSKLNEKTKQTINRYNILIKSKSEKKDLTETFCKEVFDSIQELLISYCDTFKLILEESMKKNQNVIDKHFQILSKIDYFKSQYKLIFLSELKDFFKEVKFYNEIEDYIIKSIYQIDIEIDSSFSNLNSFLSSEYTKILNSIKYKDTYKKSKVDPEKTNTEEGQKIIDYLRQVFNNVKNNWTYLEKYQNMLFLLFTNLTVEKMKDILRNAKFNYEGTTLLKSDFNKIAAIFAEYTEDIYYNEIYNLIFLTEIFNASDNDVDEIVQKMEKEGKVEIDLIKIAVKKRSGIKKS